MNMGVLNASSKFENQILSYKQRNEFEISFCKQKSSLVIIYISVLLV